jgi:hypothetical protein
MFFAIVRCNHGRSTGRVRPWGGRWSRIYPASGEMRVVHPSVQRLPLPVPFDQFLHGPVARTSVPPLQRGVSVVGEWCGVRSDREKAIRTMGQQGTRFVLFCMMAAESPCLWQWCAATPPPGCAKQSVISQEKAWIGKKPRRILPCRRVLFTRKHLAGSSRDHVSGQV